MEFLQNFDWQILLALIALLGGSVVAIYTAIKKAIKELEDVINKYEAYKKDGFTESEIEDIFKEIKEAIQAVNNALKLIKGLWLKIKKIFNK